MDNLTKEKIKKLTLAYGEQLPIKAKEIDDAWLKFKAHPEKEELQQLIRAAHTLTGTSGTYGYQVVSGVAKKLEDLFNEMNIDSPVIPPEIASQIENHIQDLNQVVLNKSESDLVVPPDFNIVHHNEIRTIYLLQISSKDANYRVEQIKQFNYIVEPFYSMEEFLHAVESVRPDMVLIDEEFADQLPPESIKQMRDESIFIIYMANKDEIMTRLLTLRSGGQAFVVKPIEINSLLRTLDNLFEANQVQNDRILIVDDSKDLSEYYATLFQHAGLIVEQVTDAKEFFATLQEFQPDIILMDVNMPFCSGIELAQIVHQQENLSGIPIIFLSTIAEKSKQLEVLSYAGDDFLTKPVDPKYLLAAVRNRLMRSKMLRSRMMRDSLTNLYNHTMIHHQLEREIQIADRYKRDLSVVMIDIDNFKSVNDIYGHQAGDVILRDLSSFLQKSLRKSDLIGRYGGEEFLLILPEMNKDEAYEIVNDLREQFSRKPHLLDDRDIYVTFSAGISNYPEVKEVDDLVKAADNALYKAKDRGRNKVVKG